MTQEFKVWHLSDKKLSQYLHHSFNFLLWVADWVVFGSTTRTNNSLEGKIVNWLTALFYSTLKRGYHWYEFTYIYIFILLIIKKISNYSNASTIAVFWLMRFLTLSTLEWMLKRTTIDKLCVNIVTHYENVIIEIYVEFATAYRMAQQTE